MRTPVPSEPRRFKLTDDCTLSGLRLQPDDRRIDGGGYLAPESAHRLEPGHWLVEPPAEEVVGRRLKKGERVVRNPYNQLF